MTDRNAQYQATYRRRAAFNAQATLLGWTKLELLSAYLTADGELVVIDKAGSRYGTEATALAPPEEIIVSPAPIPDTELGPKWQAGRARIGSGVTDLDLTVVDRATALTKLESLAASALRAVEVLRAHSGPDWREQIGLDTDS